jgi:hypothetical protein
MSWKGGALHGALFMWILWVFLLGLVNCKITSTSYYINFDLGFAGFVGGWTFISQRIQ